MMRLMLRGRPGWSSLSHASRVERSVRGTRCAAQRSNGLLALAEQGDEDGEEEGEGEKREVYSALQWETSCFYTYECEVDGRPVSEEELRAKQRENEDEELYTHVALGVVRLGSSARDASIKWRTIVDDPSMSAKPWIDYRPVTGETINFKPGDIYKEVTLRVRPSSLFSGTLELAVWLEPETGQGAYVGKCEWQYRKCEAAGVRREPVCAHGYISIPHYYCCYYYCHHHHHHHHYCRHSRSWASPRGGSSTSPTPTAAGSGPRRAWWKRSSAPPPPPRAADSSSWPSSRRPRASPEAAW